MNSWQPSIVRRKSLHLYTGLTELDVNNIKTARGLALQDIISGVYDEIDELQMPAAARIHLIDLLSQTEHRLSTGGSEKIQTTSLLGAFKQAVELMGNAWNHSNLSV